MVNNCYYVARKSSLNQDQTLDIKCQVEIEVSFKGENGLFLTSVKPYKENKNILQIGTVRLGTTGFSSFASGPSKTRSLDIKIIIVN